MSSSVMSKISGANKDPSSKHWTTCKPYEKGEIFNMFNKVASERPTLSPGFKRWTGLTISMVPRAILVWMDKAWKNEVFFWTQTGVLSWDNDINWSSGTSSSGSSLFVFQKQISAFDQITVSEDKTNVFNQSWQDLFVFRKFVHRTSDDLLHHGVLTHNDFSSASNRSSDLGKLQRGDVISVDQHEFAVVSDSIFELFKVVFLPFGSGGESFGDRHF